MEDIQQDDGHETSHVFRIESELYGNRQQFVVAASAFSSLSWVPEQLGTRRS